VPRKDQYLQYLDDEIIKYQKLLSDAHSAREHYLRFSPEKNSANGKTRKKLGRKGLRAEGRSRDLFEYFYKTQQGVSLDKASEESGYAKKDIQQFLHRYREEGLLEVQEDKIIITAKGRALVDASQPYAGKEKKE
jgi:coproporphyrinogen III oxidase-like Fe-S oxidoreductase